MPKLIKFEAGQPAWVEDAFLDVADEDLTPGQGAVILSLTRFQAEGADLIAAGREVGVKLQAGEAVEDIVDQLPNLALVALAFPKFRDGRQYSAAALLRQRYRYGGEIRAVGDYTVEQGHYLLRCGFDAFAVQDGSTLELWAGALHRYRKVYQTGADGREPIFEERLRAAATA